MEKMIQLKKDILEFMEGIDIVDNHEHLRETLYKESPLEIDLPFFLARGYLRSDLVASGLPEDFYELSAEHPNFPKKFSYLFEGKDQSEKTWSQIKPYLQRVKNTAYYQYLLIALRDLYGYEREDFGDDWRELSDKIRANSKRNPRWALSLLDKMRIRKVILDIAGTGLPCEQLVKDERLVQVVRMDGFIMGDLNVIRTLRDEPIRSLDDYLEALDETFEKAVSMGAVGIKSGLAYQRIIEYKEVPKYKAERILTAGLSNVSSEERRVFQDFMMHEVCRRCAEHKLPFQIHTGIQAGNFNTISNANPTYLTNLIRKYADVKFDIFHGGYPYFREAGLLAKYFPNAYVDGCWLTHISPSAYREALNEWLEIVPATKIFAWGGDHVIPEHTYASLKLGKELVAEVLALKVIDGRFSKKTAYWVAERIMGKNSEEVYGF